MESQIGIHKEKLNKAPCSRRYKAQIQTDHVDQTVNKASNATRESVFMILKRLKLKRTQKVLTIKEKNCNLCYIKILKNTSIKKHL